MHPQVPGAAPGSPMATAWNPRSHTPRAAASASRTPSIGEGPLEIAVVPGFVSHLEAAFEQPAIGRFAGGDGGVRARDGLRQARHRTVRPGRRGGDARGADGGPRPRCSTRRVSSSAALVGVSEGAPMCALFAATYPARTRALVMYGSYAKGLASADYPWAPERVQIELAAEMIDEEWGNGMLLDLYAPSVAGDAEFAALVGALPASGCEPGDGQGDDRARGRDRHPRRAACDLRADAGAASHAATGCGPSRARATSRSRSPERGWSSSRATTTGRSPATRRRSSARSNRS